MFSEKQVKHFIILTKAATNARKLQAYNHIAYGIVLKHARELEGQQGLNTSEITRELRRLHIPISITQLKKLEERYMDESLAYMPKIEALINLPITDYKTLTSIPNGKFPEAKFENIYFSNIEKIFQDSKQESPQIISK